MAKIANYLFLPILIFSTAQAGDFAVVYEKRIAGADRYAYIDPVVNDSLDLAGFVFCDTIQWVVSVDFVSNGRAITIAPGGRPIRTANYFSPDGDTLYVYCFQDSARTNLFQPSLTLATITADTTEVRTITLDYFMPTRAVSVEGSRYDLRFLRNNGNRRQAIVLGMRLMFSGVEYAQGPTVEAVSTSLVYSLDLERTLLKKRADRLLMGNFVGDNSAECVSFLNYYHWQDFSEPDNPDVSSYRFTTVALSGNESDGLVTHTSWDGSSHAMFLGDFTSSFPRNELIYYGDAEDLLGIHGARRDHVACYNFAGDSAREVWYRELSGWTLDYVCRGQPAIVGGKGGNNVIFLDYRSGRISDSIVLNRTMSAVTFFETEQGSPVLNLVGRSRDTVLVYQFESSTSMPNTGPRVDLPETFHLYQNHPNPFNNETSITFDNATPQHLSLRVYNILGQIIATLFAETALPGSYEVSWNGVDETGRVQASGIYFARLESATATQIVKLILLK